MFVFVCAPSNFALYAHSRLKFVDFHSHEIKLEDYVYCLYFFLRESKVDESTMLSTNESARSFHRRRFIFFSGHFLSSSISCYFSSSPQRGLLCYAVLLLISEVKKLRLLFTFTLYLATQSNCSVSWMRLCSLLLSIRSSK